METPATVRDSLRPGDWVTSIDLTDAYFHILMHPADRKWLRFRWGDQVYQFRALPFGLSLAPWIFTMVVRQFCALVRSQGIRLRAYLDDWLILSDSQIGCSQHTQSVLREANLLGFSINRSKSELIPSQTFTYLGMSFDTVSWTVQPSQRRVDKLQAQIRSTLPLLQATLRSLASILGQMESMALLVPLGRVHKRPFQLALKPYLPGRLNTLADALSRSDRVLQSEWTITHGALLRLWAQVQKPLVDLFATRYSKRLPVFVSPFPDPQAWRVDALDIPWTGLEAYAFPPFPLLSRVIRKAELEGPALLLVAPLWPSQVWFPDLLRLALGPPIPLAAPNRCSTRGAQSSEASRVEVVRDSLRRSGASSLTLDLVGRSHRASTASVYASHWKAWATWCSTRGDGSRGLPALVAAGQVLARM
ncbi:uncharacterized protein [Littorina saxatilis]|uniref:uncharacterized protein n=1 Tax=Littorina saxatilis TaxID=31220 RepID=UPI0038B6AC7A